jgi:hypothetical protein
MIYLYAFTDQPQAALPDIPGLQDGDGHALPITSLAWNDVAAVFSQIGTTRLPAPETNVWRHEAVVEALMATRTVLPLRYNTLVKDVASLQTALAWHYDTLSADLQRLRGQVELSLRVAWETEPPDPQEPASPPPPPPKGGRAYMLARLEVEKQEVARRQHATDLAAEINAGLSSLAAANQQQVLPGPGLLLKAAYLMPREQIEPFRQQVGALTQAHPELYFLCVGPWPPYSFVSPLKTAPVQPAG